MYVGPAVSGFLHLGLLALALAPARPEPIISPDSGPSVEVELMSLNEYNAAISRAPDVPPAAMLAPSDVPPPAPEIDLAMNVPTPAPSPRPTPEGVTLSAPPLEALPEVETATPSESSVDAQTDAPELALDLRALQDRPIQKSDIIPDDRVRIVTAPEAPEQPRGVLDAPEIDTDPDEPPEPELQAEPTPEPPPSTEVAEVETPQRNGAPPSDSPLPRAKPRGSLAAESSDEKPPASPVAEAGEGPQQRNAEDDQDRVAEVEEEKLAAEAAEEQRIAEEDARIAAEDARLAAEAEAAEEAERKAAEEFAERELAELKAAEEKAVAEAGQKTGRG